MSGILWLASYPKSGNTWLRVFLTNYWRDADEPADINRLNATPIASGRDLFDDVVGLDAADLLEDEIDALRGELYARLAEEASGRLAMKIHDAYTMADGRPIVPSEGTRGAVYVIRNPLDVAVSFAHHSGWPVSTAVRNMNDESFALARSRRRLSTQLRQRLLSWSGHVKSWVDGAPFPVHVVRFEDMKADPVAAFSAVVRFSEGEVDERRLRKAIAFSDFRVLKQMEEERGFDERSPAADTFFRKGETGSWRSELSTAQGLELLQYHTEVMRRFAYTDASDPRRKVPLMKLDRPDVSIAAD